MWQSMCNMVTNSVCYCMYCLLHACCGTAAYRSPGCWQPCWQPWRCYTHTWLLNCLHTPLLFMSVSAVCRAGIAWTCTPTSMHVEPPTYAYNQELISTANNNVYLMSHWGCLCIVDSIGTLEVLNSSAFFNSSSTVWACIIPRLPSFFGQCEAAVASTIHSRWCSFVWRSRSEINWRLQFSFRFTLVCRSHSEIEQHKAKQELVERETSKLSASASTHPLPPDSKTGKLLVSSGSSGGRLPRRYMHIPYSTYYKPMMYYKPTPAPLQLEFLVLGMGHLYTYVSSLRIRDYNTYYTVVLDNVNTLWQLLLAI